MAALNLVTALDNTLKCVAECFLFAVFSESRVGAVEHKFAESAISEIGPLAFISCEKCLVKFEWLYVLFAICADFEARLILVIRKPVAVVTLVT